jgi:hypothetical protein
MYLIAATVCNFIGLNHKPRQDRFLSVWAGFFILPSDYVRATLKECRYFCNHSFLSDEKTSRPDDALIQSATLAQCWGIHISEETLQFGILGETFRDEPSSGQKRRLAGLEMQLS